MFVTANLGRAPILLDSFMDMELLNELPSKVLKY